MNSAIEKITLYDFFGYLIPGLTFLLLAAAGPVFEYKEMQELIADNTGIVVSVSLLCGFVCGLVLSEVFGLISDIYKKAKKKYFAGNGETQKSELDVLEEGSGINKESIRRAIERSGYKRGHNSSGKILSIMYGNIQADEQYKRIHNYASSEVLAKNLATAVLAGGLAEIIWMALTGNRLFSKGVSGLISVIWLCVFLLLVRRYRKFGKKKERYTVIWFVQKYRIKNGNEDKTETADYNN